MEKNEDRENPFKNLANLIKAAQDYIYKDKSDEAKNLNKKLGCWVKILNACLTNYENEINKEMDKLE